MENFQNTPQTNNQAKAQRTKKQLAHLKNERITGDQRESLKFRVQSFTELSYKINSLVKVCQSALQYQEDNTSENKTARENEICTISNTYDVINILEIVQANIPFEEMELLDDLAEI